MGVLVGRFARLLADRDPQLNPKEVLAYFFQFVHAAVEVKKPRQVAVDASSGPYPLWLASLDSLAQPGSGLLTHSLGLKQQQLRSKDGNGKCSDREFYVELTVSLMTSSI